MTYFVSPYLITYYYIILLAKFLSEDFNYLYITMFKKNQQKNR